MRVAENRTCDAMHFTAIYALAAEIHCDASHVARNTAIAIPRRGELRETNLRPSPECRSSQETANLGRRPSLVLPFLFLCATSIVSKECPRPEDVLSMN